MQDWSNEHVDGRFSDCYYWRGCHSLGQTVQISGSFSPLYRRSPLVESYNAIFIGFFAAIVVSDAAITVIFNIRNIHRLIMHKGFF